MVATKKHCSYTKVFLLTLFLAVGFAGCVEKKVVNSTSDSDSSGDSNNSNNDSGDTDGNFVDHGDSSGYNHPDCKTGSPPGIQDGSQVDEYYKVDVMPKVIAHGTYGGDPYDDDYVWSSAEDLPTSIPSSIFITDSRFNLRIKALPGVRGEDDAEGNPCNYDPMPYEKLSAEVVVKTSADASSGYSYTFKEVPVDEFSKVHEFGVPPNASGPLVVEIKNLEWDYTCTDLKNQADGELDDGTKNTYCPMYKIWKSQCVALKFEFATDVTKDIPCPRTN